MAADAGGGNPWRRRLDGAAAVALILASGAIVWSVLGRTTHPSQPPAPVIPAEPVSFEGAALRGSPSARVVVNEFADFECPACGQFARSVMPDFIEKYVDTGKVLLAYRHFPLERIHPLAFKAAVAAECAGQEGRFWEMYEQLFAAAPRLEETNLLGFGQTIGLDQHRFPACLAGDAETKVRNDVAAARGLKLASVPSFLIGTLDASGRLVVKQVRRGGGTAEDFAKLIDPLLQDVANSSK
jgi:protein-disulfide isomerase